MDSKLDPFSRLMTCLNMSIVIMCFCIACGTKTIVQRPGTVGVVSAPAKSVHVLLPDSTGKIVEQVIDLAPGDEIKTAGPK